MLKKSREVALQWQKKYNPTLFDSGIGARLPKEYKKFYDEWKNTPPEPIHYIPEEKKWKRNEVTGEIKRIENVPLPGFFTKELHQILTGGEVIIQGFIKKKRYSNRVPHFWMPCAFKSVVYSEILDKYISVIMTQRVIHLIHRYQGLDKYLMETKACDLGTLVALRLKKKLLSTLLYKELPYDEEKNNTIFKNYEKYLLPPEELEWYGLTFSEACKKQLEIEDKGKREKITPLKQLYRSEFIKELKLEPQMDKH